MKNRNQMNSLMLSGLLALSLVSCKKQTAAPTSGDYKTLTVTTTDRTTHSSYSASIQGKQDVEIYPQVSGLITKVCIKEGASVKKRADVVRHRPSTIQGGIGNGIRQRKECRGKCRHGTNDRRQQGGTVQGRYHLRF